MAFGSLYYFPCLCLGSFSFIVILVELGFELTTKDDDSVKSCLPSRVDQVLTHFCTLYIRLVFGCTFKKKNTINLNLLNYNIILYSQHKIIECKRRKHIVAFANVHEKALEHSKTQMKKFES